MRWWQLLARLTLAIWLGGTIPNLWASGPATGSNTVVRIEIDRGTNRLGTLDVELFDQDKPETVRNFLLYTRSGAYSNMFLHRCVPGFVIQGGGFRVADPLSNVTFSSSLEVTNLGRLTNEFSVGPRLTNSFGTIAMAKIGNDPNSASSQWFFNLGDNSANLDNQNGGFTVFGRVLETTNAAESTNVLRHFNTLATGTGIVSIASQSVFNQLPVSYTNSTRAPTYRELYYARVYVLGETNTPGLSPPTITLSAPPPNSRFTNQPVIISGTASDDLGVARVIYRLSGAPAEIAAGTNSWQVGLNPQPGFNTVSVESIDWEGNHSTNSPSVTFFYVSQLPLNLQITGQGKVDGLTNGQLLQVGSVYTALAKPSKGYFFDGWTGLVSSASATLTFQVATNATNLNLTARFTPNFFPRLAGSYQGLLRETNALTAPGLENTGLITLTLNRKGGFSGRIRHRGGTYSYTGRFDRSGGTFLQGTVGGINRTITLRLDTTNEAGIITGTVSGATSSSVEAQLERLAKTLPATNAPLPGDYPFVIPSPAPSATGGPLVPGGNGYGRATLNRNGSLKIKGTLGDGAAFAATVRASRALRWPLYLNLARGQGAVQGWVAPLTNQTSTLEARLAWMRAVDPNAATYRAGFSNQVTLTGMRYVTPMAGRRFLSWVTGLARIEGANLALGVTNSVRLSTDNVLTVPDPNPASLRLHLDLATGLVDGSFVHPWVGTTNALHGVMFKPGESIRGQFLDGDQTGSLTVNIAPFLPTQTLANVTLEGFTSAMSEGGLIVFEGDGLITLTNPIPIAYNTALDANGHSVQFSGAGLTRLFLVPTNLSFSAAGFTFADGLHVGTNGATGDTPQPGGDACGAGVFNEGGTLAFTNCVFTNFLAQGGSAGTDTSTNAIMPPGGRALGAALCNRGGQLTLQDCQFVDNLALAGEGNAPPLTNRISDALGAAMGGAIFSDGPQLLIQGTAFRRSEARGGPMRLLPDGSASRAGVAAGGAVAAVAGSLALSSNSYHTNVATGAGVATNTPAAGLAYGGALFVESNVTAVILRSVFSGNLASGGSAGVTTAAGEAQGGALYGAGSLQIGVCTLDHNVARGGSSSPAGAARGGAIAATGFLNLTNSTLDYNVAEGGNWTGGGTNGTPGGLGAGGALHIVRSNLSVLNCTFAFNQAVSGPESDGVLTNGNQPGERLGGAIAAVSNNSNVIASTTFAFNSAGSAALGSTNLGVAQGGAIANQGAKLSLLATLLVSNAPANFQGTLTDNGYNFSSDDSVALAPTTGATNVDLLLGPLTDNGGPTLTMSLAVGSPARDRVPTNSLTTLIDQRGVSRPQPFGGMADAGAVEASLTNAAPIFIPPPPASAVRRVGSNVTFQATAVATNPISYFWIKDGFPVAGATNSTLTLVNLQVTNAGLYALVATNIFGAATSAVATLTIDATPRITTQPVSLLISPTTTTSFMVAANPTNGLHYYWFHDGLPAGPDAASYPITSAAPADRGFYFVVVSNAFGVDTSAVVTLTFNSVALNIVTNPASASVAEGQTTNFTVVATGFPVITYQWLFGGVPLPGKTNNTLVLTNITPANAGTYRVVVTNAYLSLTSSTASLTVDLSAPPFFTQHPASGSVHAGSNYTFQVAATGSSITYSWLFNDAPLPGASSPTLTLTNAQATNAGTYAAIAANSSGSATSLVATLTVDSTPLILTEPIAALVAPGAATNFTVEVIGPSLVYAWRHDDQPIADATNAVLLITNAMPADRGAYQVIITNDFGSATSRLVSLTFDTNALAIITQPTNTLATTGTVATFTVVVAGVPPFAYQWTFDGSPLLDETNSMLVFASVAETNAGNYQVVVTNAYLALTSVVATLTVDTNAAPAPATLSLAPTLSVSLTGGRLVIQCQGQPAQTYRLLQSDSAAPPGGAWQTVATEKMPATGRITWTLPIPPGHQSFYRAVSP